METISLLFLGTDREDRIDMLLNAISLSRNATKILDEVVLSIDCFNKNIKPERLVDHGRLIYGNYRSQVRNISKALESINAEWILYTEDDCAITFLPERSVLNSILNTKIDNRQCGMLGLNCGGSLFNAAKGTLGDLDDESRVIVRTKDYIVFLRDELLKSEYFICMPGFFIRKHLFEKIHNYAVENIKGLQIERALTQAWFDLSINQDYFKLTMTKPDVFNLARTNPLLIDESQLYIKLLDPMTGSSSSGGSNVY